MRNEQSQQQGETKSEADRAYARIMRELPPVGQIEAARTADEYFTWRNFLREGLLPPLLYALIAWQFIGCAESIPLLGERAALDISARCENPKCRNPLCRNPLCRCGQDSQPKRDPEPPRPPSGSKPTDEPRIPPATLPEFKDGQQVPPASESPPTPEAPATESAGERPEPLAPFRRESTDSNQPMTRVIAPPASAVDVPGSQPPPDETGAAAPAAATHDKTNRSTPANSARATSPKESPASAAGRPPAWRRYVATGIGFAIAAALAIMRARSSHFASIPGKGDTENDPEAIETGGADRTGTADGDSGGQSAGPPPGTGADDQVGG